MSTFTYHKPGIGNAASYQVSGIPLITSSLAPPLSTTSVVVNLPRVARNVTIKNTNPTAANLRVSFNDDSIVDNTNYLLLTKGESFSGDLRVTDLHLISDSEEPVLFTVVASLTNIERREMTQNIPRPPNLLAWIQKQKLLASGDANPGSDEFGASLCLSSAGNILAVGALSDEENGGANAGSVYIFQDDISGYRQVQKLTASGDSNPAGDRFGHSVSIVSTGQILAVSAPEDEENGGASAGAVYIFQSGSGGYQQTQKLTASGDANPAGDYFGQVVTLSSTGNILAVSAHQDEENGGGDAGSVYIFQSGSGGYQQVQKLTASGDASPQGDQFGRGLALSSTGRLLAVGPIGDEVSGIFAGSVYIFESGSGGYQQVQKLTASDNPSGNSDFFGVSLSFSETGEVLAVGATGDEENGGGFAGSVYMFQSGSTGFQQVQKLTASGETDPPGDFFGQVSLSPTGKTLAVGAAGNEQNGGEGAGAVFIFQSGSSGYQQVQKLTASGDSDPAGDFFGFSLAVSSTEDTLTIGSVRDEENGSGFAGSVYVFRYTRDY